MNDSSTLAERLSSFGYRAGWALTRRLPTPVADRLFTWVADKVSDDGRGPEQLRANLGRVVGDANVTRELVRDSMRSYMRYWREAFQLPSIAGPELAAQVHSGFGAADVRRLDDAIGRGRGVVLSLPHSGNWDMAGVWLVDHFGQFATVAERLRPESLFEAFVEYRESLGFEVLALSGGEVPPFARLREVLDEGGIVCLLGERDLSGRGVEVSFFGERTSMPAGAARLAQETGAALMVYHSSYVAGGWASCISEELDTSVPLAEIVQQQADIFARNIAAAPADWHMLQPLWFSDLSTSRRQRLGLESPGAGDARHEAEV
ncbi:phosphatidylinositol mannoside acyltransferase [Corynebacterium sp.]|uniref:phosphatidylinositol mannoside acyltransferase n=1 Tax=Corynebacterium sp. TaxID=1720 RepID=UPI0028AE49F1|nr:phosphatidylinositol mannoside acyltransferase [Corynebacterium sp.]